MAEQDKSQKTEEPTPKRLSEAHEKGQVAKSQEISNWFMLSAATLVIALFADRVASDLTQTLTRFIIEPHRFDLDQDSVLNLMRNLGNQVDLILRLPILFLLLAAFAGHMVQNRPVFSLEKIKPQWNKISLASGAKRMFGLQSVINLAKSVAKIAVLGAAALFLIWPEIQELGALVTVGLLDVMAVIKRLTLTLAMGVVGALTAIALLDMLYQKWDFHQNQRMSRQEIKDETKQTDGDPQIKARIRQLRMERARQRMMAEVPGASVIITNPTHFAVALKYDQSAMAAPKLVAKGQDLIAQKIREVGVEHDIPIVENPPLARALHAGVELDQEVPPTFYKAVAEVIGYVMGLRDRGATARSHV